MQSHKFLIFTFFCTFAFNTIAQEICSTPGSINWPHPDCTKFYICSRNGSHEITDCPPGFEFDITRNGCATPPVPECVAGTRPTVGTTATTPIFSTTISTTTTTPTTTIPTTAETTTTSNPIICPIGKTFWPHEECSKFYICVACNSPILHDCPEGYYYNSQIESCDNPVFGTDCEPGGTRPTTTTTTTPTPVECPPDGIHRVPHPGRCDAYFYCINGVQDPELHICNDGLLFNPETENCDPFYICPGI